MSCGQGVGWICKELWKLFPTAQEIKEKPERVITALAPICKFRGPKYPACKMLIDVYRRLKKHELTIAVLKAVCDSRSVEDPCLKLAEKYKVKKNRNLYVATLRAACGIGCANRVAQD